ncbi:MAG: hypothetical protein H7A04_15910 [Pseudomonadales bacterium]|nr:hypothetical protein [Pseudomonadales bacterium]MCP5348341.1 hypothetical protein [Pseudomonadales bacterium]
MAFSLASQSDAQSYIGEYCWKIETGTEPSSGEDFVLLAFQDIGDFHLTVNGYSFSTDDVSVDERMLVNGNAELFENALVM